MGVKTQLTAPARSLPSAHSSPGTSMCEGHQILFKVFCFLKDGGGERQMEVPVYPFSFLLCVQLFLLTAGSADLQQLASGLPQDFCKLLSAPAIA